MQASFGYNIQITMNPDELRNSQSALRKILKELDPENKENEMYKRNSKRGFFPQLLDEDEYNSLKQLSIIVGNKHDD